MKAETKTQIVQIINDLKTLHERHNSLANEASVIIDDSITIIETIKDELTDKFEELSEKTQEGDKGQELQSLIDKFDNVLDALANAKDEIENAPLEDPIGSLEELTE